MTRPDQPYDDGGQDGRSEGGHREDLAAWRALLRGNERAALERIALAPRVRLVERCLERMRRRATLLDPERVIAYVNARLAFDARDYDGGLPLEDWLDGVVDGCLEDLVQEDLRGDLEDARLDPEDERYAALAQDLGIDVRTMRRAAVVFAQLPRPQREVFYEVVLEQQPLEGYAAATGLSLREAQTLLERATESFGALDPGADGTGEADRGRRSS